jgi:hypothetical protein
MKELVVKDISIREKDAGYVYREERVPVFENGEIQKDKMGRTIWKVTKVKRKKYGFNDLYLCFDGQESSWLSIAQMTNTFGKNKTRKAIKAYLDNVEEK